MKKILCISMLLMAALTLAAQTQHGLVKTIGRPNKPGVPLAGVVVRVRGQVNAVVSNANGEFELQLAGKKKGDPIVVQSARKEGYELRDREMMQHPHVYAPGVRMEILMVNLQQLAADKKRIEANAIRVANENFQKKVKEMERLRDTNEISADEYRRQRSDLQEKYEQYLSLVGDLADRYARTDYDQLDSLDREINICIEEGELDRADSLIRTVFDPETVLDRNRTAKAEIRQRIEAAQRIIDKATADKEAILRDMQYGERVMKLGHNLAEEYCARSEYEKAINCLRQTLEMERVLCGPESEQAKRTQQQLDELREEVDKE